MSTISTARISALRRKIMAYYRKHGRDLPFRKTTDPYKITVAEIMLQQTQVERVVPKYAAWIVKWPTWHALAKANNRELLTMWSGLGYNRRALNLGRMARQIVERHGGVLPTDLTSLCALPGIGPYTSRAILIFAFNRPLATIDTNIRRVIIYELGLRQDIAAASLEQIARQVVPRRNARDWHNALMDYGATILTARKSGIKPLSQQSRFEGSSRQIRGEIVRQLTVKKRIGLKGIASHMSRSIDDVRQAAKALKKEGVLNMRGDIVVLAFRRQSEK